MGYDWAQCAAALRPEAASRQTGSGETASPGSDVPARAPNRTRASSLMTERKETEEVACWDLGHSSVSWSLRGCQKVNQTSIQSASLIHPPEFSSTLRYGEADDGRPK